MGFTGVERGYNGFYLPTYPIHLTFNGYTVYVCDIPHRIGCISQHVAFLFGCGEHETYGTGEIRHC